MEIEVKRERMSSPDVADENPPWPSRQTHLRYGRPCRALLPAHRHRHERSHNAGTSRDAQVPRSSRLGSDLHKPFCLWADVLSTNRESRGARIFDASTRGDV